MRSDPRHANAGFTLIELLVVISIIALLISILLPALKQARESGRSAVCLSNQRQLALSMGLYQNDYNGYFPQSYSYASYDPDTKYPDYYWPNMMWAEGYIIPSMLECPSFVGLSGKPIGNPKKNDYSLAWAHYGYNTDHLGTSSYVLSGAARYITPARADEIKRGSQTILTVDSVLYVDLAGGSSPVRGYCVVPDLLTSYSRPYGRHSNDRVINVAWVDGHVSSETVANSVDCYPELSDQFDTVNGENLWDRE